MFDQKDKEFLQELISPLVIDICEIKVEMKAMRRDIDELKTDVAELKADMKDVKQRLTVVENDVAELKTDVAELRSDVDILQQDTEQLTMRVHRTNIILENDIPRQIGFIADGHKFLEDKMDMIININDEHKLLMVRMNVLEGAFQRHCGMTSGDII